MDGIMVIILIVAMFNIILFFKIWGMTNNVKRIMSFYIHKNGIKLTDDGTTSGNEWFVDKDGNKIEMI
jgi:hypothetical protein